MSDESDFQTRAKGEPAPADDRTVARTPDMPARVTELGAVPGYALRDRLGVGGMGVVYRAEDIKLGRTVALKVMLGDGPPDEKAAIRFLAEAQAAAAVKHPNVVEVYDYGEYASRPYMALEFCPGGTLAGRLKPAGEPPVVVRLAPRDAAELVGKIANGVAAAHAAGIVHRDLKPANVLFGAAGEPKVTDFGIAKRAAGADLTQAGVLMGTPQYMSPEQAGGGAKFVGPAADVWALGVILYQAVAGGRPFDADTTEELLARVVAADFVPLRVTLPGVPRDLDLICRKCLEKDPADRYPSAAELAADLGRLARGEPISVRPAGPAERAYKWSKRNPVVAGLLSAVVLALTAGTIVSTVNYRRAEEQRAKAEAEATAKGQALADLEVSAKALQKRTEDLLDTKNKLRSQKSVTDATFLRSVLYPLNRDNPYNGPPGWNKLVLLWELSSLDDVEVRTRLPEVALTTRGGPLTLMNWREELVPAVVGMDRRAAIRLRERLAILLGDSKTTPEQQLTCAMWVAELPAANDEVAGRAARVLADWLPKNPDTGYRPEVAASLGRLADGLSPGVAAAVVRPLAREMASRSVDPTNSYVVIEHVKTLRPLAPWLEADEVAKLNRVCARTLAAEVSIVRGPGLIEDWTSLVKRLPASVSPEAAAVAVRALAEHAKQTKDENLKIGSLVSCMCEFGPMLSPAEAASAAAWLAEWAAAKGKLVDDDRDRLVAGFDRLAARLAPADVSKLARDIARRFTESRGEAFRQTTDGHLSRFLGVLDLRLGTADSADIVSPLIRTLAGRVKSRPDGPFDNVSLLRCLGEISNRPSSDDEFVVQAAAQRLARQATSADGFTLSHYADGLIAAARWLDRSEIKSVTNKLIKEINDTRESWKIEKLIHCSVILSAYLAERDAVAVAQAIANRVRKERDPETVSNIAEGLIAALKVGGSAEIGVVVAPPVKLMADRLAAQTKGDDEYRRLGHQLGEIGRLLGPAESTKALGPAVEVIVARLTDPKTSTPDVGNLAERLSLLGCRVDGELTQKVRGTADLFAQRSDEESQKLAMMIHVATSNVIQFNDVVKLYNQYVYTPPSRKHLLRELGQRSGRTRPAWAAAVGWAAAEKVESPPFADVWEFVDWAEKHRQGLDLTSRPAVR